MNPAIATTNPTGEAPPNDISGALYVHIPWCVRKCPYCDFNSHTSGEPLPQREYLEALERDLDFDLAGFEDGPVHSIFLGGGTPSLMEPDIIAGIIALARQRLRVAADAEVTLEANPGSAERSRFAAYRDAGVNRLSIGVQSFDDRALERIGRIHDGREARLAAEAAAAAGFDNVNLDLMFGLPGQTLEAALQDIGTALAQGPGHLSWYQLTIEPNTGFAHRPPPLPDEDLLWAMQDEGRARLQEAGFVQYEVSAFARPGRQCRHNLNYWQFGDYFGIGAGAHAKRSDPGHGVIRRYAKRKHPRDYMETAGTRTACTQYRELAAEDRILEFMLNALRLRDGFSVGLFEARTGLALATLEPPVKLGIEQGLLERAGDRVRPTARGHRFLNDLLALFVP